MNENPKNPENDKKGQAGTEHQDDELDIGNDLSVGSENGSEVSDFDPYEDRPEVVDDEEDRPAAGGGSGDSDASDDNGINPSPGDIDPQKKALNNDVDIENSDEDEQNPYPDEIKPDEDDHKINSTWMMSGQNRNI
jgi:hypothetical protein